MCFAIIMSLLPKNLYFNNPSLFLTLRHLVLTNSFSAFKITFLTVPSYQTLTMDQTIEFLINITLFFVFITTFASQIHILYRSFLVFINERLSAPILNNITYWCFVSFFGFMQSGYKCIYIDPAKRDCKFF